MDIQLEDGRTKHTDVQCETIKPRHYHVVGYKSNYFWQEGICCANYKDLIILNIGFEIIQLEVGYIVGEENQGYHLSQMRQNGRFHNCMGFLCRKSSLQIVPITI